MTRNTHDLVNDHFGDLDDAQIASGTPTSGQAPLSNGDGTRTWGDVTSSGGGLVDLVTGDDQTFAASLGSWTNSGGTMTRDTTYAMFGQTASLKYAVTTAGQYVDLAVAGTFTSGRDYWAVFFLSNESTSSTYSVDLTLGLIGTDSATVTRAFNMGTTKPYNGNQNFVAVAVHWIPTADRTGVSVRMKANFTSTTTWHIGMMRVWETPILGPVFVYDRTYMPQNSTGGTMHIGPFTTEYSGFNATTGTGGVWMADSQVGSIIELNPSDALIQVEHAMGDFATEGIDVVVGEDYLGFFIGQKDATTVQFYGDWDDYDFEFADGATKGWYSRDASNVVRRFATMESRKGSGSATILDTTTSIAVTHGAGYTPSASDITVTPTNNPTNDPGNFWISSVGATTFTINVRADPGASGATFAWRVDR